MEQFLGFALPGVPYGCTYALVAVCLVLTYQATGVFNFAFGAQAFASAFIFTYLTQYHNWSGFEAFLLLGGGDGAGHRLGLRPAAVPPHPELQLARPSWSAAWRCWSGSPRSCR